MSGLNLKQTEREISKGIEQILQLDGWRTLKCEPMSRPDLGKGFGEIGMPDLLAIRYHWEGTAEACNGVHCLYHPAEVLWVEMKSPTGRVSPAQRIWHAAERERGALTIILGQDCEASVVGFVDWYRQSGLNRRVA